MKRLIICGKGTSGKSLLAGNISLFYDNVAYISGRNYKAKYHFNFGVVNEKTDLIIVDDLQLKDFDEVSHLFFPEKLKVDRPYKAAIIIPTPDVIITMDVDASYFENIPASLNKRFKIINTWMNEINGKIIFQNEEVKLC